MFSNCVLDHSWFFSRYKFQFWQDIDKNRLSDVDNLIFPNSDVCFLQSNAIANFQKIGYDHGLKVAEVNADIRDKLRFVNNKYEHHSYH